MKWPVRFISTAVIFLGAVALLGQSVSGRDASKPLATCPLGPGTLSLWFGISHEQYWRVGPSNLAAEYAKGNLVAREYMADHEGDWCLFGISLEESAAVIPRGARIVLTLADGSEHTSTDILAVGWPPKREFWRAADGYLTFDPDSKWTFAVSPITGEWLLYVRFPEKSCLTGKPEGEYARRFKSPPKAIRLVEGGETYEAH